MKRKLILSGSLLLAIAVAVFGLLTFLDHQKQEKAKQEREKYENYFYYTALQVKNQIEPIKIRTKKVGKYI